MTPLAYLVTGAFRPIGCKHFACVAMLACTTILLGMAESDRHKAHQCTQSLTALLAFLLLQDGLQQLAGRPLHDGRIYVHIDPLAVTIKQEAAIGVLLCPA